MTAALIWDPALAEYRFPSHHPMKPERFTLAVELMRAWELLDEPELETGATTEGRRAKVLRPAPASIDDLRLFHSDAYISAVREASAHPSHDAPSLGLGDGDTPTFEGMHEAASLAVGGTMHAVGTVLGGVARRAFNPAGGLHHAHRGRASGFCVYNDCAIAIERATREHPGLRVAYVDIDAHHGDGVEEAFHDRSDVLTLSVHESGRYLFPGTGDAHDIGEGAGVGYTLNVPLPPGADPACYDLVFREIIRPALRHFHPELIVAQIGADSNEADPLTHLQQTVAGELDIVGRIIGLADELCDGRIVLTGGGVYEPYSVVPRIWAGAMALALDREVPPTVPAEWVAAAKAAAAANDSTIEVESDTFEDEPRHNDTDALLASSHAESSEIALVVTQSVINTVRHASPLMGGGR